MLKAFSAPIFQPQSRAFYYLYSPSRDKYLNWDCEYCEFEDAEEYNSPYSEIIKSMIKITGCDDLRWIGPYEEGEKP